MGVIYNINIYLYTLITPIKYHILNTPINIFLNIIQWVFNGCIYIY